MGFHSRHCAVQCSKNPYVTPDRVQAEVSDVESKNVEGLLYQVTVNVYLTTVYPRT